MGKSGSNTREEVTIIVIVDHDLEQVEEVSILMTLTKPDRLVSTCNGKAEAANVEVALKLGNIL